MKKKTLALVMTAAMAFSALTGCGTTGSAPATKEETTAAEKKETEAVTEAAAESEKPADRPEVRVLIKWSESQISNWPVLVDEYNADDSNPVKINLEFYGSEGYDDKVKAELMGDNPPEIVQLMKTTFNEYSANGQLMELTGFLGKRDGITIRARLHGQARSIIRKMAYTEYRILQIQAVSSITRSCLRSWELKSLQISRNLQMLRRL